MEILAVTGQTRTDLSKGATSAARREGNIPAVLYGGDEVIHFTTTKKQVKNLIYTPDFKLVEITVEGKTHRAILKDVQFHPVTDDILHIDFLRLIEDHPIKVSLPVRFKGIAVGVKSGGKLQQNLRRVKVKTTPDKLIDQIVVDVTTIEMGQSVRVRDIQVKEGIEILSPASQPLATIEVPRVLRSATSAAEKEGGIDEEGAEEETED